MLAGLRARATYLLGYLPVYLVRRLHDRSPFSSRAHRSPSGWDR